ncbi:S-adenosyl-L-methionine-dependent methyltransferase [Achaetomium macrosporum]|uniref:S-adenosyl-L-methionine-dependent methyltransferase n=1 Tax=Achaetomium macrosporum TaxID=79813 RepID=A0AAN7CEG8_9PEZI|nr:S-adenosyl-L-methionine-dependent methyltransferase [Achaetomium macrosporum]
MATADELIASLQGIDAKSFANEAERIRARDAVFDALRRIQSPWDIAWDHNWVSGAINAAIKTLIDAGVFTKWAEAGGEPITCVKLAEFTGADVVLIRRMMRAIAGQLLVTEVAPDTYARTPWARALAEDPSFAGMYGGFYHELNNPMFRTLPYYLKKTGFRNPTNVNDCNFQFWRGEGASMFQYVGTNPLLTSDFNDAMECHSKYNLTPWVDIYPTDTIIAAAKERGHLGSGRPLVVDVGGGKGHDLRKFLARHPDVPAGSLVLEDLPDILKGVEAELLANSAIAVQPHDFFMAQPEGRTGARVYFMHNVLHDWLDETARQILRTLATAMEPGYSRLLIHESLVSNERPLSRVTVSDLTMMACLAAAERSEDQWRELIASAGLRLVKIWRPVQSVESIIEVEVVKDFGLEERR